MSEQYYPLIEEKAGEDYHTKPRLFWAYWYVATLEEPERYPAGVREHVREKFTAIDQDPEKRQELEAMLAADQAPDICRDEPAGVQ
jgi:hypothetical protein